MGYVIVIPWLVRLYMFFPAESRRECQQKFTCLTRRNMISSTRPACLGNCYFFGQLDPGQKPTKVYQFSQRNMIPPASPPICPPDNSDPSRRRDPGRTPAEVYPIPGRNIARARPPARHRLPSCPDNFDSLGQRDPVQTPKKFTRSHGCNRSILTCRSAYSVSCSEHFNTDPAGQPVL